MIPAKFAGINGRRMVMIVGKAGARELAVKAAITTAIGDAVAKRKGTVEKRRRKRAPSFSLLLYSCVFERLKHPASLGTSLEVE